MLRLIEDDVRFCRDKFNEQQIEKRRFLVESLLVCCYRTVLSRFTFDQRMKFVERWNQNLFDSTLPVDDRFHLLNYFVDQLEMIDLLLQQDKLSSHDEDSVVNSLIVKHLSQENFVLFVENVEQENLSWKAYLAEQSSKAIDLAERGSSIIWLSINRNCFCLSFQPRH